MNACGRLNKPSVGINVCLGNKSAKNKAVKVLSDYKKKIVNAINWYKSNLDSGDVIKKKNIVIINAKDKILPTIIGTLASIISKSNDFAVGTFILSLARNSDGCSKASLRLIGKKENIDLQKIMIEICKNIDETEAGGHMEAAGALLPTEKEDEFIERAINVLEKYS